MRSFRAMILAAGLGTRLRPLTLTRPKVLVPVQNRPLLHWLIEYLRAAGAEAVIMNAHHLGPVLTDHVEKQDLGIPVQVRVEESLLGTAGGIRNVADFWDERPFVVVNGDILSSIDLQEVLGSHESSGAWATLVLTDEPRFNSVQIGRDGRIIGFSPDRHGQNLAFTGIQVLTARVLAEMPAQVPLSIIDCYQEMINTGRKVMSHVVRRQFWREIGSLDGYLGIHLELFQMTKEPFPGLRAGGQPMLAASARFGPRVRLEGMVCIGADCVLEEDTMVQDSVLWEQVRVTSRCSIRQSIIGDGVVVKGSLRDTVVA